MIIDLRSIIARPYLDDPDVPYPAPRRVDPYPVPRHPAGPDQKPPTRSS